MLDFTKLQYVDDTHVLYSVGYVKALSNHLISKLL